MNGHETEYCDLCGSEFETGYWRRDRNWCEHCLSMADEPTTPSRRMAAVSQVDLSEDEDWLDVDLPTPTELGFEAHSTLY